jgi:hypothetical protein
VPRREFRISARRLLRISGQLPEVQWKPNHRRTKRTITQAEAIARKHGVEIPDDVAFFEAEPGELNGTWDDLWTTTGMETARGPAVYEHPDGYIYWKDHYNIAARIPFLIHPDILRSDEAIVAVFCHEMYELAELRAIFVSSRKRRLKAEDYGVHVAPGHPGNLHDQAWDAADRTVLQMRKGRL